MRKEIKYLYPYNLYSIAIYYIIIIVIIKR